MRTITAMFDSRADAEIARSRLTAAGIGASEISIHDKSSLSDGDASYQPGSSGAYARADGTTDLRSRSDVRSDDHDHDAPGLWAQIKAFFTGDDVVYEEGMRRGGYLVTARVADHEAERVIDILDDDGTVDLGEREAGWRREGWTGGSDAEARRRIGSYASDDLYR